jgi:hypothetical protein
VDEHGRALRFPDQYHRLALAMREEPVPGRQHAVVGDLEGRGHDGLVAGEAFLYAPDGLGAVSRRPHLTYLRQWRSLLAHYVRLQRGHRQAGIGGLVEAVGPHDIEAVELRRQGGARPGGRLHGAARRYRRGCQARGAGVGGLAGPAHPDGAGPLACWRSRRVARSRGRARQGPTHRHENKDKGTSNRSSRELAPRPRPARAGPLRLPSKRLRTQSTILLVWQGPRSRGLGLLRSTRPGRR